MNTNIIFSLCSFIYMLLITITFFSKKRIQSEENRIYSILVVVTLVGLSFELISALLNFLASGSFIQNLFLKLITLYFFSWIYIFYIYIYSISKKRKQFNKNILEFIYLPLALITLILPLYAKIENNLVQYTYGPSVTFIYLVSGTLIFLILLTALTNFKSLKSKKYIPLFAFCIVGIIVAFIQAKYPQIILLSSMETLVTIIMYFTIENPDVQIMEELYKNKKLIERSNEDTSNFLFKVTQDIKKPVKDIINVSNELEEYKDIKEMKKGIKYINNVSNELDYLINDALDVSNMTTKRIKIFDIRYNPLNTFKEIEYRFENELPHNIKFKYTYSNNIPEYLYGDNIKLKQAINSVLKNALEHTEEGEISLEVSALIKYGICRLIIDITDTGEGMSIDEVNDILSLKLENIDIKDKEELNLKEVKKLISLMGGNLMVKSDEKGTTVNIVLDQKKLMTK